MTEQRRDCGKQTPDGRIINTVMRKTQMPETGGREKRPKPKRRPDMIIG